MNPPPQRVEVLRTRFASGESVSTDFHELSRGFSPAKPCRAIGEQSREIRKLKFAVLIKKRNLIFEKISSIYRSRSIHPLLLDRRCPDGKGWGNSIRFPVRE